ncbi:MAG TPA: hypothetical protein VGD23_08565 [Sphingomicrobium sp.]
MIRWIAALALIGSTSAIAQSDAKPLFASDAPIRLKLQGPIGKIVGRAARNVQPEAATLTLVDPAETHAIRLSPRGLSRRTGDICQFPPLRIEFAQPPPATSLFAGQRRLKLVTHCRPSAGFQQHLLMEYATYRMLNQLSPLSYRARLATVDYAEPSGKVSTSRWGFLIEDVGDVARRNGLTEARVGDRILSTQLEARQAARVALFQYMIGNLDWSMRAGPPGEGCCHNSRLLSGQGAALVPVAYDFDYSGLVDAPYAMPPEQIPVRSVRTRFYQGYCRHNPQALAAAAEFRAQRGAIEGVFGQIPGLEARTRSKALSYLNGFFAEIATDESMRAKILKNCLN